MSTHLEKLADWASVTVAGTAIAILLAHFLGRTSRATEGPTTASQEEQALEGRQLDSVVVSARDSGLVTLVLRGRTRLILLYRSSCPVCQQTKPAWAALVARLPDSIPTIALTLEPPDSLTNRVGVPGVRVFQVSREELDRELPSDYIPVTLVVSKQGRIAYAHIGILSAADVGRLVAVVDTTELGRSASR